LAAFVLYSHGTISPFLYGGEKEEGRKKEKREKYGQKEEKKKKKERKGKKKGKKGLFLIVGIQISYPGIRGKIKVSRWAFTNLEKKVHPHSKPLSSSGLFLSLVSLISWEVSTLLSWG